MIVNDRLHQKALNKVALPPLPGARESKEDKKVQNETPFRPLKGAMESEEKCPFCGKVEWLICLRGDLKIVRARRGEIPVAFGLRIANCISTRWNIDLPAYDAPQDGMLSEDELVQAIQKSSSKSSPVIILRGCSEHGDPRQWAAFFADEKKESLREFAAYCPLLLVDSASFKMPQTISAPEVSGPGTSW